MPKMIDSGRRENPFGGSCAGLLRGEAESHRRVGGDPIPFDGSPKHPAERLDCVLDRPTPRVSP